MQIKKILCLLLCLTMLASLMVGCGNQEQADTEQPELILSNARVVVDGIVYKMDIYAANDRWYLSSNDMKELFGEDFAEDYIELSAYAQNKNIRYTQDKTLDAIYFNTWESYNDSIDLTLFQSYIDDMGLPTENTEQETISGKEMSELLDALVNYAAPEKLADWQSMYPDFRTSAKPITRLDVIAAIFLAAEHIGGDYSDLDYSHSTVGKDIMQLMQADGDTPNMDYFGWDTYDLDDFGNDHCGIGAICYNLINFCSIDGSYPISYDRETNSFRNYDNATYIEAMAALLRVVSMRSGGWLSVYDPAAVTLSAALTQEHIEKAQSNLELTAEEHPVLQGFMGGTEYSNGTIVIKQETLVQTANWGFNTYCLKFDYTTFFDDDVENVNLNNLVYLDSMVATAIENNLHLCLMATTLPGRWTEHSIEDYTSTGEFDLFINSEKQVLANRVWEIISERYKDIPSANLSFCPFWEATNHNLSSGLSSPDYTEQDIAGYLRSAVDAIRAIDSDRMIIYEPGSGRDETEAWSAGLQVAEEKGNMLILSNYVSDPFVYASMTSEEGQHIDNNNHSTYVPLYPTYYYELDDYITEDEPLIFDGFLPTGTTINIYLERSSDTDISFYADEILIHSEKLVDTEYEVGYPISGYIPFSTSDKLISTTLSETANKVKISPDFDGYFAWCGIEIILPEDYTQEKWYYASAYDVFLRLEEQEGLYLRNTSTIQIYPYGGSDVSTATIYENLTFTTSKISEEASSQNINACFESMKAMEDTWIIRYEDASFAGMSWSEVKEYYADVLDGFDSHEFSWLSNDWGNITERSPSDLAGSTTVEYMGYSNFNLELLELLQSYQK